MPHVRPKILAFAGSTRGGSYNAQLAALVARSLATRDVDVTLISLADYPMPLYNGDLEAAEGVPEAAKKLKELFVAHQGVFIASPEYNASVTPLLKNTLDWVSRVRPEKDKAPTPFKGRVFAVGAASNGTLGGMRSLMQLRQILELGLGALVIPEQISVAGAATAFDEQGGLSNPRAASLLDAMANRLVEEASRYAV